MISARLLSLGEFLTEAPSAKEELEDIAGVLEEPRVRHTQGCLESARPCSCTELDRLHDDWKALRGLLKYADLNLGGVRAALYPIARSRAALEDLHERIRRADGEELCRFCILEEGP